MDTGDTKQPQEYFSYLLRLWKVRGAGSPGWRAALEDVHTGERKGFADVQGLVKFLEEQVRDVSDESAIMVDRP